MEEWILIKKAMTVFNILSMSMCRNQMQIEIKSSSERLGSVDREEVGSMVTNNIWSTAEALVINQFT